MVKRARTIAGRVSKNPTVTEKWKLMATPTPKPLFAVIDLLPSADLFKLASAPVELNANITESRETERKERKFNSKVVAAMKRRYVARLNAREIAPDTTFAKYYEQNAGGKCPGRVQSLAGLFNNLVLTEGADKLPLLTEATYDGAMLDWLEKANAIVNAAIKVSGENWKSSDDVNKAIAALTGPPDNVVETLDAIRAHQKGESPEATAAGEAVTLTVGRALEFLLAYIKNDAKAATELEAATLFAGCDELGNAWGDSGVSEDLMNKWNRNIDKGVAPEMNIEATPLAPVLPAAPPAPETTAETPAETSATEDKELVEQS